MRAGTVYREKRIREPYRRVRYVGVVTGAPLRIQTVQNLYGVWVRQMRSSVRPITQAEFAARFTPV